MRGGRNTGGLYKKGEHYMRGHCRRGGHYRGRHQIPVRESTRSCLKIYLCILYTYYFENQWPTGEVYAINK